MSDGTKIEWTDATWNLINGCTVVSPGCEHCYAMRLAATRLRHHPSRAGLARLHKGKPQWTGEITFNRAVALDPMRWRRPRKIFVCAHGDLFHPSVPDPWIDYVFMMALLCPRHVFQVLTKRPMRMREYMRMIFDETEEQTAGRFAFAMFHAGLEKTVKADEIDLHWPPRNVWLGTSVEDQERANERIPDLLATPAAVRWLSCEPLIGPVDLEDIDLGFVERREKERSGLIRLNSLDGLFADGEGGVDGVLGNPDPHIDWVVAGGESGPDSRPMHPDWARSLRDQCVDAGVPFLFKQWGSWAPLKANDGTWPTDQGNFIRLRPDGIRGDDGWPMQRVDKHRAGRLLDGLQHDGYPA